MPALYLDTLKVSTTEQTGDSTWAQGGKGNARLVNWDYNKAITVNLEDALCTPAGLGLCYSGILSADWKNNQVDIRTDACGCQNPVNRVERMEKAIYPRSSNDPDEHVVSSLLPRTGSEKMVLDTLTKSEVVDGTRIQGTGMVNGKSYRWRLVVESGVRSVAQVPDRFFDVNGRSYPIDWNSKVSVFNMEAPAYGNFKDAIIYKIGAPNEQMSPKPYIIFDAWMDNHFANEEEDLEALSLQRYLTEYKDNASAHTLTTVDEEEVVGTDNNLAYHTMVDYTNGEGTMSITDATHLAIVVDNNDNYHAFVAKAESINSTDAASITWCIPTEKVNVSQFKGLDMWIRFESINSMIYFMITKYQDDIMSIVPAQRTKPLTIANLYGWNKQIKDADDKWADAIGYVITYYASEADRDANKPTDAQTGERYIKITQTFKTSTPVYGFKKQIRETTSDEWTDDSTFVIPWYLSAAQRAAKKPANEDLVQYVDITKNAGVDPVAKVNQDGPTVIENYGDQAEERKLDGRLWAYINPRTMKPYDDTYWFHQGEPYYVKSLTIAPAGKQLKANKITIKADQWPGMYMMLGETYIRNRDTGEDERLQIKIPLCKVQSNQTLTLQADGDPTTFSATLEVANPKSGVLMEINTYEVATRMQQGDNGCFYAVDGSSQVLSE